MSEKILARVLREAGAPRLVELLAGRLSATDLQSLLLEVARRRVGELAPRDVLRAYERGRFYAPSPVDPRRLLELERLALSLLPADYAPLALAPLCPFGTVATLTGLSQDQVVTTVRTGELLADATNALALECAARRRRVRGQPVRLWASARMVRGPQPRDPTYLPHFGLVGLVCAGRDEGSFRFETRELSAQLDYLVRLVRGAGAEDIRVAVADLSGLRESVLAREMVEPLVRRHPEVRVGFDRARTAGYYVDVAFRIDAGGVNVADGGAVDWTQSLLSDRKERLLIAGVGAERLLAAADPGGSAATARSRAPGGG